MPVDKPYGAGRLRHLSKAERSSTRAHNDPARGTLVQRLLKRVTGELCEAGRPPTVGSLNGSARKPGN